MKFVVGHYWKMGGVHVCYTACSDRYISLQHVTAAWNLHWHCTSYRINLKLLILTWSLSPNSIHHRVHHSLHVPHDLAWLFSSLHIYLLGRFWWRRSVGLIALNCSGLCSPFYLLCEAIPHHLQPKAVSGLLYLVIHTFQKIFIFT